MCDGRMALQMIREVEEAKEIPVIEYAILIKKENCIYYE